ncbi:D-isomer specific 2-hydroxyacid dehydrogenase [Polychytrium aggregatum]|uniref:D-isomer specific 2-hydroxyacid dehydrogenase n=1 Tax=Polychytrium aggregatum TaxID=110093 RepID=UPI0022FDB581|nr:D-isomer specific 2-hydroxyacid dehydrogenase [Polychytrium aggregatum]KAI9203509.1 D-isomer specific 2-hydroxyacid dehydrogenase [Polychytrium aggregatum]
MSTARAFRVLQVRNLPPAAQARLEGIQEIEIVRPRDTSRAAMLDACESVDGVLSLLAEKIDRELLDRAGPTLKVVSTVSVGYDHIDVAECKARNIKIGNTPDVLTDATADLAVGLLIATARRFPEALRAVHEGTWGKWTPTWMCGTQLQNKSVGIVGLGRIGIEIALRLKAFKMGPLRYWGRQNRDGHEQVQAVGAKYCASLPELFATSDILIVACALTPETRHLIDLPLMQATRDHAILLNVARGSIIKQDDLVAALKEGKFQGGVGLDVTDPEPLSPQHELLQFDRVCVLPHIGSAALETREAMANLALDNLMQGLQGRPLTCSV